MKSRDRQDSHSAQSIDICPVGETEVRRRALELHLTIPAGGQFSARKWQILIGAMVWPSRTGDQLLGKPSSRVPNLINVFFATIADKHDCVDSTLAALTSRVPKKAVNKRL